MAQESISKETLEYLANLARIDLTDAEKTRYLGELQNILHHVAELQAVDTEGVTPMNGGGEMENVFRDDAERANTNKGEGPQQFPASERGYLKVPPILG